MTHSTRGGLGPPATISGMEIWEGARNLADLGGLPTADGGRTATGRVWRCAAPEWITETGWASARAAGLTTVVDLRNEMERGRQPTHPQVSAAAMAGIEVVATPTEDPDDPEFLAECGPWLDHPKAWVPNARRYPEKFRAVFEAVAAAPGGVLVHCAGGRDRTGMIGSMLLQLNGATPEAIAANYASGFRGAGEHQGHGFAYDQESQQWVAQADQPWDPAELEEAVAIRVPAVLEWAATCDARDHLAGTGVADEVVARLSVLLRD